MAGTNIFGWTGGGGSGGGGGTTVLTYVPTAGATINLTTGNFDGTTVIGSTDSTGTTTFNLPAPSGVTAGDVLRLQMVGGNLMKIVATVGTQTLDGVAFSTGLIINQPSYPGSNFTPSQLYGIYKGSDGNWHTAQNG